MVKRVPSQRQQIDDQISSKNRNLGRVITKNSKIVSLGEETIANNDDNNVTFTWRKRSFVYDFNIPVRTPDKSDFIWWATEGNPFQVALMGSTTGRLVERNIPRHTNVSYSIEVFRKSAATINNVILRCQKSVRIEVNGEVIHDSGDNVNNTRNKIDIHIPAQKWTRIDVYFYSADPNTDNNFIELLTDFSLYVDRTRNSVPLPPTSLVASQGTFQNEIKLTWEASEDVYYDRFQVWYGNDINTQDTVLTTSILGDDREYIHGGVPEGTTHWYKIRGITSDGDVTSFSDPAEGWSGQGSTANSLRIETEPNQFASTFPTPSRRPEVSALTSGYFTNETIYFDVLTEFEIQNAPTVSISGADGTAFNTFVPLVINATDEGQTDAFTWRYSFDPSVFLDGRIWLLAEANAGALSAQKVIVYDTNPPTFNFSVESDDIPTEGGDPYTRSQYVNILTNGVNDARPQGSRYDDPVDGYRHVAGPLFLSLSNNQVGYGWFEYLDGAIYNWDLGQGVVLEVGERTVYATLYDRAGNANADLSDTIYYATGTISDVTNFASTEYYDKIHLSWSPVAENDLYGYKIWRNDTGVEPSDGDPPTINIPDVQITGYYDLASFNGGELTTGTTYYYWIKGYTLFGRESATFVPAGATNLRTDIPNPDTAVSVSRVDNTIQYVFKNAANEDDDPDQRAVYHHIYRYDVGLYGSSPVDESKFRFLQTITHTGDSASTFTGFDIPPLPGHEYNYWSLGENKFGFFADNYGVVDPSSGITLNDGPPGAPAWSDANMYQTHHIIRLAWLGGVESDIEIYKVYRESGTNVGDPAGNEEIIASIPYNELNAEMNGDIYIWDDIRSDGNEGSIQTGEDYTYWVKAYDTAGEGSAYSDPRTFSLSTSPPPVPQWVSGSCYAWFGYNHLVITGGVDSSNLVRGYHIYRALVTGASNYNHSGSATHIGSIPDSRAFGITNTYDDHDVDFGSEYQYWCTSYNDYESDWSAALTGLGVVKPNYDTLFVNLLDNSSFEKTFDANFNWNGNASRLRTGVAAPFGHYAFEVGGGTTTLAAYSGYIMVEPSENYMVSLYGKHADDLGYDLRIEVNWYSPGKEFLSTDTAHIANADFSSSWQRLTGDALFTAPASATSATMRLYTLTSNQTYNIDAVQFERYVAGESPRPYIDSTVITADVLGGHIIRGDMIVASSIQAIHISGQTITADQILASSITLDRLETIPGAQVSYRVTGVDYSELVRNDPTAYLIDSGTHTIYVPTGILRFDTIEYEIDGVKEGTGVASAVGGLLTANNNSEAYYGFYDADFPTKICFSSNMSDAFASGNFLVWKFTNRADSAPGINAGYFVFDGPFSGPPVVLDGSTITAGEIHGQYITASSIEANRIVIGEVGNLVYNAAFGLYDSNDATTGTNIPISYRSISNWRLSRGNYSSVVSQTYDYLGLARGPLYDTSDAAPKYRGMLGVSNLMTEFTNTGSAVAAYISPYVNGGLASKTSNYFIYSDKIPVVQNANYRISTHFLIGDTVDAFAGGTWTFLGIKAFDSAGNEISDPGAVAANWLTPTEHGDGNTVDPLVCYYVDQIRADEYVGQTSTWMRTGYDLVVTGADVYAISVIIGTTVENRLVESQVPHYWFDGVMLENASGTDSPWREKNETVINGGSIYTSAIKASHISTDAIEAQHISAGAVVAGSIAADAISGGNLIAGTLTSISSNILRNGNFVRWNGQTQHSYNNGTAYNNPYMLDGWLCRYSATAGNYFGIHQDSTNRLFGQASIILSGRTIVGTNNYIDTNIADPVTGDLYMAVKPSTTYTMGYWLYKHAGSDDVDARITLYERNAGGDITSTTQTTSLTSADNGIWKFVSRTITTNASTDRCRLRIHYDTAGSPFSPYFKFSVDGVVLVEGDEAPSGYTAEASTVLIGDYFRTGTIDADVVTLYSSDSSLTINASGITVGTAGGDQTLISNRDIKYVKDGTEYQYAKRVEIYERVPIGSAFAWPVSFIDVPKVMIAPSLEVKTYDATYDGVDQYLTLRPENITSTGFTPKGYITTGDSVTIVSDYGGDTGWVEVGGADINTETYKWSSGSISTYAAPTLYDCIAFTNPGGDDATSVSIGGSASIVSLTSDTSHPRYGDVWWEVQLLVGEISGTSLISVQSVTTSGHIDLGSWGGGFGVIVPTIEIDGLDSTKTYGFQIRFHELGGGSNAITDANLDYFVMRRDYESFDPTLGTALTKGYVRVLAIEDSQSA